MANVDATKPCELLAESRGDNIKLQYQTITDKVLCIA